ncbi:hypothetical protein M427DRAFT_34190 [Gonapodya prolifera JEL478]|uniref:Glyoxalase-like domain-containing protein n=1 Tax=Gonapodya prolifera (strain JEL478) TaxID=1344416 RepID=A0A139A8K5_GONPJ|nr:hypothetical protein M427DRAFT_34190 [Gonapodya prolifera JEL478]|eukprot:KXS13131.1 hypothetical protein M427DRAFT_34190 [Gonapodya prolifera JEL478]
MTRSDQVRLRQIALIAKDVKATQQTVEAAFGIPLAWKDPGLGPSFGLENINYLLNEYSPWPPIFDETEGPSKWLEIAKSKPVSRLLFQSVTVQSQENPHMVAAWFLDLSVKLDSAGASVIDAMNMSIQFVQAPKSETNGIACIDVGVDGGDNAVKEAFERACNAPDAKRGSFGGRSAVKMVGVWWRFERSQSTSKANI